MTASFRMACYIFMAGITLIGGACAPSATGKTDSAASGAAGAGQPGGDQRAGEGQRGKTGESDTDSSLK